MSYKQGSPHSSLILGEHRFDGSYYDQCKPLSVYAPLYDPIVSSENEVHHRGLDTSYSLWATRTMNSQINTW